MQVEQADPKTWFWHWRIGSLRFRYPPWIWQISNTKPQPPLMQTATWVAEELKKVFRKRSTSRQVSYGFGSPSQSQRPVSWTWWNTVFFFFSFSPNKRCWFVSFYLLERFIEENSEHDMSLVHFQCSYMSLLFGMSLFPNLLNKLLFKKSSLLMPSSLGLPCWVHYSVPKDLALYGQMDWELFHRCSLGFLYPQA